MEQERLDLHQRLLPDQQLRHAVGHRRGDARGRGGAAADPAAPGPPRGTRGPAPPARALSSGVSETPRPAARADRVPPACPPPRAAAARRRTGRGRVAEDPLARLFARQPFGHRAARGDARRPPRAACARARPRAAALNSSSPTTRTSPGRRERAAPARRGVAASARRAAPAHRAPAPRRAAPRRTPAPRSRIARVQPREPRRAGRGPDRRPRRHRIEHPPAADRDRRRVLPQDEAIAARQDRRRLRAGSARTPGRPGCSSAIAPVSCPRIRVFSRPCPRGPRCVRGSAASATRPSSSVVPW